MSATTVGFFLSFSRTFILASVMGGSVDGVGLAVVVVRGPRGFLPISILRLNDETTVRKEALY